MVANVYQELDNILKNNTYSILICQSFPFTLVQSFRSKSRRKGWTIVIEHDSINNKKWNKIQIEMLQNLQHNYHQ